MTFTIVVTAPAIVFSPTSFANQSWTVGTAVDLTLPAGSGGVGTLTASLTGTLPAGVTFTASTRALAGNPTAVFSVATFTYTLTDAEGESASITFTIVVAAAAVAIPSNLTGTGVQVGSAVEFGIGFGGPTSLASDGTTVFMFHLRRGYTLDPLTGIATQIGGNNLGLSFNPRISAAMFHNGEIIVHGTQNDELYTLDTTTNTLTAIGMPFTIAGSNSSPVVTGITSLNGTVYAAEAFTDALMTLDIPSGVLTPVDGNTVGYGLTSPNIQSLAAYKGMLVAVNIDSNALGIRLVELSTTDGTATAFNNIVPPDNAITGMVEHNDQLLAAGNANDALYRMYDVLWNETIDDLEVDESDNETWSLADISQDGDTFSLPTSPPSWLSVSGTDLVATNAPAVTADQDNDVTVRASRSGIDVDEILRIVVKDTGTPPTNTAPVFADASYAFSDVAIAVGTVVGTVAATDADNDTLSYSLTGASFAIDANGQITVAVELTNSQIYSFNVVADDGTDTTSVGVSVTAIAATLSFGSETIDNQAWVVGTAASVTLPEATGGNGTITYSLSPALPSGKTFTASTRVLDGTPTGRFTSATFTYTATDADSNTVTLTFTIVVTAIAITIPNIPNQSWTVGTAVSLTLPEASGGVGAFTYSLSPTLPAGVSRTNRAVTGNPTTAVTVATYTYTAEDSEGITQTRTFTIVVAAAVVVLSFGSETISNQAWVAGTAVSVTLTD